MVTTMILGGVQFNLATSLKSLSFSRKVPFAIHDVMGAEPVPEDVGLDSAMNTITGIVYPEFLDGMGGIRGLEAARDQRIPVPWMRGDFVPLGWQLIEEFKHDHGEINEIGHGREVTFDATLRATGTPSSGMAAQIFRILF